MFASAGFAGAPAAGRTNRSCGYSQPGIHSQGCDLFMTPRLAQAPLNVAGVSLW